jgi:hypothetical protein
MKGPDVLHEYEFDPDYGFEKHDVKLKKRSRQRGRTSRDKVPPTEEKVQKQRQHRAV